MRGVEVGKVSEVQLRSVLSGVDQHAGRQLGNVSRIACSRRTVRAPDSVIECRHSCKPGPVAPAGQTVGQLYKVVLQRLPVRLPGLAVHPRCRIAPERVVGRLEAFDRVDVMQQSAEPRSAVPSAPFSGWPASQRVARRQYAES